MSLELATLHVATSKKGKKDRRKVSVLTDTESVSGIESSSTQQSVLNLHSQVHEEGVHRAESGENSEETKRSQTASPTKNGGKSGNYERLSPDVALDQQLEEGGLSLSPGRSSR